MTEATIYGCQFTFYSIFKQLTRTRMSRKLISLKYIKLKTNFIPIECNSIGNEWYKNEL
jgi:hypothetical protein